MLQGKVAGLSIYNKGWNPNDDAGMDHKFRYLGWSIWNEDYNALKLKEELIDTLEKWYPGNWFFKVNHSKLKWKNLFENWR